MMRNEDYENLLEDGRRMRYICCRKYTSFSYCYEDKLATADNMLPELVCLVHFYLLLNCSDVLVYLILLVMIVRLRPAVPYFGSPRLNAGSPSYQQPVPYSYQPGFPYPPYG